MVLCNWAHAAEVGPALGVANLAISWHGRAHGVVAASCTQLLAALRCKRASRGCDAKPAHTPPYPVLAQLLHGSWESWEHIRTSHASPLAHTKLPLGSV